MVKISIVVPIYNAEEFLEKCVESLINQTCDDIEILLINDGSTDRSLEICEKFSQQDKRIKIFNQSNQGVSQSRNTGLQNAKSELITFVDADDWIEDTFCEMAQENYLRLAYDILSVDAFIIHGNNRKKNEFYRYEFDELSSEIKEDLILQTINKDSANYKPEFKVIGTTWAKIYRTEFLKNNNLLFNKELTRAEDHVFLLNCLSFNPNVRYIKKSLYNYRRQEQSTVNKYTPNVYRKFQKTIAILNELCIIKEGNKNIKNAVNARVIMNISSILANDSLHKDNNDSLKSRINSFREVMKEEPFKYAIQNVNLTNLNRKGVILALLLRTKQYRIIFKVYNKFKTLNSKKI